MTPLHLKTPCKWLKWIELIGLLLAVSCLAALTACAGASKGSANITPPPPTGNANFFVATDGNDSWSGTLAAPNSTNSDGPFLTIGKAQTAVQGLSKSGLTQVVVMIRQGTYSVPQGLSFGAADSGTSSVPILWENYPTETPVVSGGVAVTGWSQGSGGVWSTTLPANTQYFEQLFYNGTRRLRARLDPDGNGPVGTYLRVAATISLSSPITNCPDQPAGSSLYECFDRFQYTSTDPISSSWTNLNGVPTGNTSSPCTPSTSAPQSNYPVGDIALYSFEQMGMSKMLISCIDTTNDIIYLTGPIRIDTVYSGFIPGHRYLVENAKNTFSEPGQWFLDRSSSPWTLSYIAQSGENPSTDTIIIPQAPQVLVANSLQYVTFSGITFQNDNYTVPSTGYAYQRLDQAITSAVSCQNCQNVTFDTDIITQTAGTGLDFTTTGPNKATKNNTLQNSAIYDVASHGVRIGLLAQNSDSQANLPQFTTVQNNVIEGFGRIFAKGFGIAQGCNHDNKYTQNEVYDGYSGGINIGALNCPTAGNVSLTSNNVAEFNLIYNLGQGVSNDFGCVYFNTSPYGATPPSGNQALNNVCHDISDDSKIDSDGYGGQGIYIDNYTGNILVQNNLVFRVSGSTVAQTCGPEISNAANIIQNNVLAFSRQSVKQQGCTPTGPSNQLFSMTNNIIIYDRGNIQGGCFSCLGGNCSQVLPATVNLQSNLYCYLGGSGCTLPTPAFFSSNDPAGQQGNCTQTTTYNTLSAWQAVGEDLSSSQQNAFSGVTSSTNNSYGSPDTPMAASIGFSTTNYLPQQAGLTNSTAVPTAPAIQPTFLTAPYGPAQF